MVFRRLKWILFGCLGLALSPGLYADEAGNSYLQEIRQQAEQFLQHVLTEQSVGEQLEITLSNPDPRIALARCDNPLTYSLHGNALNASNVTVKVACIATPGWSFYLTASVIHWREVAVAARSITRGAIVTDADIRRDRQRLSGVGLSAYSAPEAVIGMAARRPIRAGSVIRTSQLTQPLAVRKGEMVKLRAANSNIAIVTSGEALANGKVGQQIRIRNSSSDRVVRARVTGRGLAEVLL